jgi:DNA-binding transcriptional regulator YbjK
MRRSPNPVQRRRALCDAAIRLLAEDGVKSATHLKVDRKAGVPDGTTSFYFRTSSALLRAVAERIAELDLKDLTAATRRADPEAYPSGLATLVVRSLSGARLVRTKARNELALQGARDPELATALRRYTDDFAVLIRDAVMRLQPEGTDPQPALIDAQTYAVQMFIGGVMLSCASGDRRIHTAEQLDALITGVVRGIAAESSAFFRESL